MEKRLYGERSGDIYRREGHTWGGIYIVRGLHKMGITYTKKREGTYTERRHTRRGDIHGERTYMERNIHGEGKRTERGYIRRGDTHGERKITEKRHN